MNYIPTRRNRAAIYHRFCCERDAIRAKALYEQAQAEIASAAAIAQWEIRQRFKAIEQENNPWFILAFARLRWVLGAE